ncbi:MAG: MarR family transcriptional regulator [Proteobacteria bacterium]|nr:MarR family transcriptional regulator [Pseudomonadota bacterium]
MAELQEKDIEDREARLASIIHELALMAARIFNRRVKELGFTRSQWEVIYLLHENDGQTQTEIAAQLIMAKPPLGKLIDRLEKDQWLERRDDPADRRAKRVFLTPKSSPVFDPLEQVVSDIGDLATDGFSDKERREFVAMLTAAHKNLSLNLEGD